MKRRQGRIPVFVLIICVVVTIFLMFLEFKSKHRVKAAYYKEKIAAAELTQEAFGVIKQAAIENNIPIDKINDPNETALIGIQYSPITTRRGDLNEVLTSTNANFAALIVGLVKQAGIKPGDQIAVAFTGSYPGLNIAVLSTLNILDLEPIIITSVGSAMWGANYPQFNYLDMERAVLNQGLTRFKSDFASLGGVDDMARGLSPEGRELIKAGIVRNQVEFLSTQNLEHAIDKRFEVYTNKQNIRLFINVAEQEVAYAGVNIDNGLIKPRQVKQGSGLIMFFARTGVPIINLDNPSQLAEKYGLPIAPIPLPQVGSGSLYFEHKYSVIQAIISLVILVFLLFVVLSFDIEAYFKRSKNA